MNRKQSLAIICLTLIFSTASYAKIYRWVDDNGKVHFTDTPPATAKAEEHNIYVNSTAFAQPAAKETTEASASQELAGKNIEPLPEPDAKKCEEFTSSAQRLRDRPRARVKGEDGEYRYLSETEISEYISNYDNAASIYCG